jgi:hypothetical protein
VAALRADSNGEIKRRKTHFWRMLALVVDDIALDDLMGAVSYVLTTSPGKHQVGIYLDTDDDDCLDADLCDALLKTMVRRGMVSLDKSGNNVVRYVRLPVGENHKPRESGHFAHELMIWAPNVRLSLADAAAVVGVDLDEVRAGMRQAPGQKSEGPREQQADKLERIVQNILNGEAYHESLIEIAASLIATGMHGGATKNLLRALMKGVPEAARDGRWRMRYADIGRAVDTAELKFKPGQQQEKPPSELLMNLKQLQQANQSVRWLVKHVLPADSLGVIFGGSGTFKSFIALDVALHVAHGLPWLGRKTKRGPVIYIAAEGGSGLWRRIQAWHKARKLSPDGIEFYVVTVALDLILDASTVVKAAEAIGVVPVLVTVDTMSQTFSGEENSANEVAEYFRSLGLYFRALWQACVQILHHSGHMATERPRGSSAIRANVDYMFGVFREEKEMIARMECHKQKDGETFEEVSFGLDSVNLGFDEDGDVVSSLYARHIASDEELQSRKEAEAARPRSFGKHADTALKLAQLGMSEKAWRSAFYSLTPGKPDDQGKNWRRAVGTLVNAGAVELTFDPVAKDRILTFVRRTSDDE